MITINLNSFLNPNENVLAGREQGERARSSMNLDSLDKDKNHQVINCNISSSIIAITPSFYLGFFFKSYKRLGEDGFKMKYLFKIETEEAGLIKRLSDDLEEGKRAALDSLDTRSFLEKLL
jgi:hypothetical protein